MFKFKVGDQIVITAGKDQGQKGKIEKILKNESKVVVPSLNIYKRHRKATRAASSGIYEIARPIPIANIALICPKCTKQTRAGFELEGRTKYRICKKCQGRLP